MTEEMIGNLLMKTCPDAYESLLKDAEWELFYHVSSMRESLFNWYPFEKKSKLLQVSSGFGALTGLFARKVEEVIVLEKSSYRAQCIKKRYEDYHNVSVLVGSLSDLPIQVKYDYIVIEDSVSKCGELEQTLNICQFLKETGRLLFVCENRFGMKYWCGVPDSVTQTPFGGIRDNGAGSMLTRKDILEALENNEQIGGWRLYYPFPDEKLPQAIYTDDYLPKGSVRDRVIPYYLPEHQKSLVCLEDEICDGLIANEVYHIFANSFLVECSMSDIEKESIFVALSTDRGWEHGFATVITANGTVQKRILHPAGKKSLDYIYRNMQELMSHGIHCVEHKLMGDYIEMPFVKSPSTIEYLKQIFHHDKEEVEFIFDKLYACIQRSSDHAAFDKCRLCDKNLTEENAGIILQKAYIDMIPYNCFYNKGEIMFYDQEFVKEFYPAKYVIFRALRYTYIYIAGAEQAIPLQYFKDRYGLNDVWDVFEKEEGKFVEDNRNYESLNSFYSWAAVSRKTVDKNIRKLLLESEGQISPTSFHKKTYGNNIYKNDEKLNSVKNVQLEIVREFQRVCDENDLSFCAFYGTLLGVVRHKGYVPWDDDIDFVMPRSDFDKLIEISHNSFSPPFFLQTPENDKGCFYGGYCKLRNSLTTGLEDRNKGSKCNQGIWIDIFPLDEIPQNKVEKRRHLERIKFFQRLLLKKSYPEKKILWDKEEGSERFFKYFSKLFPRRFLCQLLRKVTLEFSGESSGKLAILSRYWYEHQYQEYDREDFEYVVKGQFGHIELPIPNGYDNILRKDYGNDYMVYPPEEYRKPHHIVFFDPYKSYIDYI